MATHAALLRGTNVGRAKRLAMPDLKALFEQLGSRDVRTLLNSGNVAFTTGRIAAVKLADAIQIGIATELDPLHRARLLPLAARHGQDELLALETRTAYLWCPNGALESPLTAAVTRTLRDGATTLNWATIGTLQALMSHSNPWLMTGAEECADLKT